MTEASLPTAARGQAEACTVETGWASAQVPGPRSDLISQNEPRGGRRGRRAGGARDRL